MHRPLSTSSDTALEQRLARLPTQELLLLDWRLRWRREARPKQLQPEGAWSQWGIRTGRGWGKTKTGANWLGIAAACEPGSYNFIVAPTHDDVRYTCFEGPTGLHHVIPQQLIKATNANLPSITLWNDAVLRGFAAETPERLRGPQCHRAWCDEIASWRYPRDAWDNLKFGHRLGDNPQLLWTGTPKPTPFMRELLKMPGIVVTGSTHENSSNLPAAFFRDLQKYEGTAIGRQELHGEMLDPEDSGYIRRAQWNMWPKDEPLPHLHYVVMSLDTAFTEATFDKKSQEGDPTACSVWGVFEREGTVHVILLDAWEEHLGFPQLIQRVKRERKATYGAADSGLADSSGPLYGRPMYGAIKEGTGRAVDTVLIEDKGSGISLRQALASEDIIAVPYNPGKMDKLARLHAVSPLFAAGRVWAVESGQRSNEFRSWAEPLVSQVCTYVGDGSLEHDDLLDTTTQALKFVADKFMGAFTLPKKTRAQLLEDELARRGRNVKGNPYAQ